MSSAAMLVLEGGVGAQPERWPLEAESTTIGRGPDSDVVLPNREVSRRHAAVRRQADRYALVDLGSKNGVILNGARLEGTALLSDGDEILIGPCYRLRFVDRDATIPSSVRPRGIAVDRETRAVRVHGRELDPPLAPGQFALLALLASRPGHVYSRDEVAEACYPDAEGGVSDLAIDGLVRRLRTRLAEVDPDAEFVTAVRGHGFCLAPAAGRTAPG